MVFQACISGISYCISGISYCISGYLIVLHAYLFVFHAYLFVFQAYLTVFQVCCIVFQADPSTLGSQWQSSTEYLGLHLFGAFQQKRSLIHCCRLEPRHEKISFCICDNKGKDQLRSNCAADQRLCFRYKDSTIHLLHKSENLSL